MNTHHPLPEAARFHPEWIHPSVFLAEGVIIRGHVLMGEGSSVWFNAVLRADTEIVRVGKRTNIQDLSLLHADPGFPCTLGNDVTVGHRAIIHGATIEDRVMIGMGAVLLNGARVGENTIVGAGALVTEGAEIPSGVLALGAPAKVRRELTAEEWERIALTAEHYVQMAAVYAK